MQPGMGKVFDFDTWHEDLSVETTTAIFKSRMLSRKEVAKSSTWTVVANQTRHQNSCLVAQEPGSAETKRHGSSKS